MLWINEQIRKQSEVNSFHTTITIINPQKMFLYEIKNEYYSTIIY